MKVIFGWLMAIYNLLLEIRKSGTDPQMAADIAQIKADVAAIKDELSTGPPAPGDDLTLGGSVDQPVKQ
jgi:hypothetical protein